MPKIVNAYVNILKHPDPYSQGIELWLIQEDPSKRLIMFIPGQTVEEIAGHIGYDYQGKQPYQEITTLDS
jgi:hypothetical protein